VRGATRAVLEGIHGAFGELPEGAASTGENHEGHDHLSPQLVRPGYHGNFGHGASTPSELSSVPEVYGRIILSSPPTLTGDPT
jgi:hypothetical protein